MGENRLKPEMNMLMTARSVSAANKNLKMPRDSLRKLLLQLQSICHVAYRSDTEVR